MASVDPNQVLRGKSLRPAGHTWQRLSARSNLTASPVTDRDERTTASFPSEVFLGRVQEQLIFHLLGLHTVTDHCADDAAVHFVARVFKFVNSGVKANRFDPFVQKSATRCEAQGFDKGK